VAGRHHDLSGLYRGRAPRGATKRRSASLNVGCSENSSYLRPHFDRPGSRRHELLLRSLHPQFERIGSGRREVVGGHAAGLPGRRLHLDVQRVVCLVRCLHFRQERGAAAVVSGWPPGEMAAPTTIAITV